MRLELDGVEVATLTELLTQMLAILGPVEEPDDSLVAALTADRDKTRPEDPVSLRLFPDGYSGDPDSAAEFRRHTESDVRRAKVAAARKALATLPRVPDRISAEEAQAWLGALNDLRLTLGTRLDVTEDSVDEWMALSDDDPRRTGLELYHWMTWLQSTLIADLLP